MPPNMATTTATEPNRSSTSRKRWPMAGPNRAISQRGRGHARDDQERRCECAERQRGGRTAPAPAPVRAEVPCRGGHAPRAARAAASCRNRAIIRRRTCSRRRTPSARIADRAGSGSIFRRRFLTCASIARSNDSTSSPRIASSSWPRVNTRPGCRIIVASSSNSVASRSIAHVPTLCLHARHVERDVGGSNDIAVAGAMSVRRNTARTRATSSLGLNGLVR